MHMINDNGVTIMASKRPKWRGKWLKGVGNHVSIHKSTRKRAARQARYNAKRVIRND